MLLNSVAVPLTASWQMQQAQAWQSDDIVLICSGRSMQWVSLSATEQAGHFVYVDPPDDAPAQFSEFSCTSACLMDMPYTPQQSAEYCIEQIAYVAKQQRLLQRPYTAFPYQKALSRAPPFFSV